MESHLVIVVGLGLLGLVIGSFAGAQVWRLRAKQLVEDREAGEEYNKKEYKVLVPLAEHGFSDDRSRCLHCGHRLAWYDLVPLASWLSMGGKCRYCKKTIGSFEPLIEIGVAAFFSLSYAFWPVPLEFGSLALMHFVLWIIVGVMLIILFAYDLKWFLLPNTIVFPAMVLAGLVAELQILQATDTAQAIMSLNGAIIILSGLYLAVFVIGEKLGQRWIGFGDVKLGLVLALMLSNWELALLALFMANLIGCFIVLPLLAMQRVSRKTQIPFGPLLIAGFFIAGIFGQSIIDWYLSLSLLIV